MEPLKFELHPDYLKAIVQKIAEHSFDVSLSSSSKDDPYSQAVGVIFRDRKASTSYIQCRLSIGYNRAASLMKKKAS